MTTLSHGDLFSGIGGFSLAAQRCGIETRWHSEIDPYASAVLRKHFFTVPNHGDIREMQSSNVEPVDIVTAGFPCQPVSRVGRRRGTEDTKWLWPDTIRIIRAVRPRWIVLENVPGLLAHGMGDVLADLAAGGFDAEWQVLPALSVGANHIRDRLWIVAYPSGRRYGTPQEAIFTRRPSSELSCWWSNEPGISRMDDGFPNGVERRRSLGNAIVPQVAEFIFRRIIEAEASARPA